MKLWRTKEIPCTDPEDWRPAAHRYTLSVGWLYIDYLLEWKSRKTGEWRGTHTGGFNINVSRPALWGHHHTWYDGENCNFSIGFLKINWSGRGCKRCYEEGFGD